MTIGQGLAHHLLSPSTSLFEAAWPWPNHPSRANTMGVINVIKRVIGIRLPEPEFIMIVGEQVRFFHHVRR